MKRTIITLIAIAVLILLIVRMIIISGDRNEAIQKEFISKLNYDLSARVDSVALFNERAHVGFIYVTVTRGTFENKERKVARALKKYRNMRFLVQQDDGRIEIFSREATDYKAGDSIVISSAEDKLTAFRNGEKVKEHVISEDVRSGDRD